MFHSASTKHQVFRTRLHQSSNSHPTLISRFFWLVLDVRNLGMMYLGFVFFSRCFSWIMATLSGHVKATLSGFSHTSFIFLFKLSNASWETSSPRSTHNKMGGKSSGLTSQCKLTVIHCTISCLILTGLSVVLLVNRKNRN